MKLTINSLTKVVSTYEVPPIETPDDHIFGPIKFVIEVLHEPSNEYGVRVFRRDRFNVQPAYLSTRDGLIETSTIEVLIVDDSLDWDDLHSSSEAGVLQLALDVLNEQFNFDKSK